jgi:PAS domain S-box-containing protein
LLSLSRFEDQLKSIGLIPNNDESTSILNLKIRDPGGDLTQRFVPIIPRSKQPLTRMAQSAVSGKTAWDVDGYNDYRGVPVVGAWTWLDEFQFGITHEINTEEALTPLATLKHTFFLMFAMLLSVTVLGLMQYHRKQQAEKKQALEHKQVEAVSRRMQSIFDNTIDGIIIIDEQGIIESFNPAAAEIFGYTREEAIGHNVKLLMPEPFAGEHDGYLDNYKRTGITHVLDHRRELTGLHKDGTIFDIELAVSKFHLDSGIKFTGIVRDISEKKKTEQDMIQARQEAEKANTAKSQFLSQMSHELRTPLNAILGFAQIMDRDMESMEPSFRQECVDHILNGGEHLLKLIDDVLDLSRVETGNLSVSMEPTELAPLIREVLTLSEPLTMTSQINLIDDIFSETDYIVQADRVRLRQVLLNLVSNAIKYNRPHGSVTLSCKTEGENRLRISVTDTGPGISEEQFPLLFQPFSRLENEETYIEGTGIGLTICQKLADLMGGEIHMKSEVGIGSTFSIDLALSTEAPSPPQTEMRVDIPQPSGAPAQATNLIILYIEDNPANMELVKRILQRHRPEVDLLTAPGGPEGIALARKHQPSLILLDIHLPQIRGWEVFQRLRQSSTTQNIPVVAVSANAMTSDIKKALKMGFDQYLTKPIVLDEFLKMLDRHLGPPPSSP